VCPSIQGLDKGIPETLQPDRESGIIG